jgi:DNA-binding NarL/FixJ family response regulator
MKSRRLLVVEPQQLWRRTLAAVLRQLGIAEVEECLRVDAARERLRQQDAEALVLSLDAERDAALALIESLRADARPGRARLPIIVLAEQCDTELLLRLQALQVHRLLLKPFKLRQVLMAVAAIWPGAVPAEEFAEP